MSGIIERIGSFFRFSRGEMRGLLRLLPLLAILAVVIAAANRPRFEESFLEQVAEDSPARPAGTDANAPAETAGEPFAFDPNTVTLQELCRLGFSARTAAGIIKYRERGKRFEIPEDFATCYGVTVEQYTRLEPYIIISAEFAARPLNYRNDRMGGGSGDEEGGRKDAARSQAVTRGTTLAEFDPNDLDAGGFTALGFTPAQAAAIIKYRTAIGGFRTAEDFAKSYVVSPEMFEKLRPYMAIKSAETGKQAVETKRLVDLNAADSTELRSVGGIGAALVVRIMDYRQRLGGYARVEQLAEIPGMTQENFNRISEQIFVDSCVIQKIDINFASHQIVVDALGNHPYITAQGLRKLLKNRQLKGGWRSIEDMVNQNIVTPRQAEKLAPYLVFKSE